MSRISISKPLQAVRTTLNTGGSKSISNRLLVLNQVLDLNLELRNLAPAEDTALLQEALQSIKGQQSATINIHHAGTDMRFLTALLAATPGEWILTGSERLKQRPIGDLVSALTQLGAQIIYLEQENFPPLKINGQKLSGGAVAINAGVSSQFISALLLIAPAFENGLRLELLGQPVSQPYIQMTIGLLKEFGVNVQQAGNHIQVLRSGAQQLIHQRSQIINIESDWSSASYWYSICALSPGAQVELLNLNESSWQADAVLPQLFAPLGVKTRFLNNAVLISHQKASAKTFEYDFTNCPDIAQTLAVTCFGLGIAARLSGLQTLKIKETDRILALKTELEKLGAVVQASNNALSIGGTINPEPRTIETYHDHRMAMSFAPLALVSSGLQIGDPRVVDKSYPGFWNDLKSAGFSVNLQP